MATDLARRSRGGLPSPEWASAAAAASGRRAAACRPAPRVRARLQKPPASVASPPQKPLPFPWRQTRPGLIASFWSVSKCMLTKQPRQPPKTEAHSTFSARPPLQPSPLSSARASSLCPPSLQSAQTTNQCATSAAPVHAFNLPAQ